MALDEPEDPAPKDPAPEDPAPKDPAPEDQVIVEALDQLAQRESSSAPGEPHPSSEALVGLSKDKLQDRERSTVLAHLRRCRRCHSAFMHLEHGSLSTDSEGYRNKVALEALRRSEVRSTSKRRFLGRWAMVAAAVLIGLSILPLLVSDAGPDFIQSWDVTLEFDPLRETDPNEHKTGALSASLDLSSSGSLTIIAFYEGETEFKVSALVDQEPIERGGAREFRDLKTVAPYGPVILFALARRPGAETSSSLVDEAIQTIRESLSSADLSDQVIEDTATSLRHDFDQVEWKKLEL